MKTFDSQVPTEEHPVEHRQPVPKRPRTPFVAVRYDPPLLVRADAARWAIRELGTDPWVALSHVVWPESATVH